MSSEYLQQLLRDNFSGWISSISNQHRILSLSLGAQNALYRLLKSEIDCTPTFDLRENYIDDLQCFDTNLNQIASELLALYIGDIPVGSTIDSNSPFFTSTVSIDEQSKTQAELIKNGYCYSPISLNDQQIRLLQEGLREQTFKTKGLYPQVLTGAQILNLISMDKSPPIVDGDTYWLEDMDRLAHTPLFLSLAFDPYIISTAARYLGCPPIHVQTNAWFSFPGATSKNNLSMNGQMFHQDKEFIKFFKVFIYISDVGFQQGPHCYVEGSHHDELHLKGVPLSDRVADKDIGKYYDKSRIKTAIGKAGTILFGDTSCVHKGCPVINGNRAIVQLEHASSLYLSPVIPFNGFQTSSQPLSQYSEIFSKRISLNYNSPLRMKFISYINSIGTDKKLSFYLKFKLFAVRLKKIIFG